MTRLLELQDVSVAYGDTTVVHEVSLALNTGVIGCLLGPSGCGKTTLLRATAGFEPVTRGRILLDGGEVSRAGWTLPPERRQVGMVFQDFALFPHLSVAENIGFGIRHLPARARQARVAELLALVGLPSYGDSYPHALSGGQQQRTAVARAMAPRPRLLLLDEPFSSMDVELREELAREVRRILKQEQITAILVTHDQMEAFAMADRIGVMNSGRILQWDTAYNLYHRPAERFVADFIGQGKLLPGTVLNEHQVETEIGVITGLVPEGCGEGDPVDVLVRPDDIRPDDASDISGEVLDKAFRGASFLYTLRLASGGKVLCFAPSHDNFAVGERIGLKLSFNHLVIFPR
ncbi:ABC transporter ATP-binding protein [Thioalkalivibrio thiocyanodenitrificans]|uniref:ABC transporter ATP-binding protein n=1 Tax=Thioalkalivibrio thiocyanodenitrificans TaxID=243063 RepID=UPI0003803F5F|nr:ABC transporter ATP-binding protein [Thioalkalivibrio thiocyanodenitrificans]